MTWYEQCAVRHRAAGIVLDTNVLLLYAVARLNETWIPHVKRLQSFSIADGRWVREYVAKFDRVWTTPHILAEFGNLTEKLPEGFRADLWLKLAEWISVSEELRESRKEFRQLCQNEAYLPFGTTDAAIVALAQRNRLVLTVDAPLAAHLENAHLPVLNYNWLRPEELGQYEG
jgi:predicted nucleic acid-binding protein